jgi:hypothetical protein
VLFVDAFDSKGVPKLIVGEAEEFEEDDDVKLSKLGVFVDASGSNREVNTKSWTKNRRTTWRWKEEKLFEVRFLKLVGRVRKRVELLFLT